MSISMPSLLRNIHVTEFKCLINAFTGEVKCHFKSPVTRLISSHGAGTRYTVKRVTAAFSVFVCALVRESTTLRS
jgi:hypothetical protein